MRAGPGHRRGRLAGLAVASAFAAAGDAHGDLYAAPAGAEILRSSDGGVTWKRYAALNDR